MTKKKTSRNSMSLGNGNLVPSSSEINAITLSGSGIAAVLGIVFLSVFLFITGAVFESRTVVAVSLAVVFIPLLSFQVKNKFVFGNFYSIIYKENRPITYLASLIIQLTVWFIATWSMLSMFENR